MVVDTITGMDYAFRAPRLMHPGVHHLLFVNAGKQRHEVSVQLLRTGVTLAKLAKVDEAGGDIDPLIENNLALLHGHGGTTPLGLLTIDLLPGREYMLECGFQDAEGAPPHYKLGMTGSILVAGKAR